MKTLRISIFIAVMISMMVFSFPGSTTIADGGGGINTQHTDTNQDASGVSAIGDPVLAQKEAACAAAQPNDPWYRTLMPFEHYDIERTDLFPCAQFAGSMTGPNVVDSLRSSDRPSDIYYAQFNMATRGTDDLYTYAGGSGDAVPPALHTYISRIRPDNMNQIWRTYLSDARQNNELHLSGAVDVLGNGKIIAISDHTLYKLNGTTGAIEASMDMPTGNNPPNDSAFNGIDAFPSGIIIVKSFNRPVGCTLNGYSAAAFKCPGAPNSANPSILAAVDPNTFKVLSVVQLAGNVGGRVTTAHFQGRDYAYVATATQLFRYVWDGNKLAQDSTWGPVTYAQPGQTISGAAVVMNDWVTLSTNGIPATVPLSVVAVSQADSHRVVRFNPNPVVPSGQFSYYYAHLAADPVNNRIYVMDFGLRTASAIDFRNGQMSLAWKVTEQSNSYITLIGPPERRVFVETNISSQITNPTQLNPGPEGANYTEQIQWRDAQTGKLLAASDFYPPAATAAQVPPGYGGLIYDILFNGHIVALYPHPAK